MGDDISELAQAAVNSWQRVAHMMYEKANPKGAPVCDCNVCLEYKHLVKGNIRMHYADEVKHKYHYLFDREEYWVIMTDSEGCFHKVGASFAYKDEAKRYVEWRNNHDYKKETDG
jgi:hypothetical protein